MRVFDKYRRKDPRPGAAFVWAHPSHALALFFGAGCLRPGPGTWGSLAAVAVWALLVQFFPLWLMAALTAALFAGGVAACSRTEEDLGTHDAGCIVVDEAAAVWLLCLSLPQHPVAWAAVFFAFRVFDIVKLPPASWADRNVSGGLGVMLDDIFAAAWALAALLLLDCLAASFAIPFIGVFS